MHKRLTGGFVNDQLHGRIFVFDHARVERSVDTFDRVNCDRGRVPSQCGQVSASRFLFLIKYLFFFNLVQFRFST